MTIQDALKMLKLTTTANKDDIKRAYREACKIYHPDKKNGSLEIMQTINEAYNTLKNYKGKEVENSNTDYVELYAKAINSVNILEGVQIELCGSWIWLTGNTKEHKDKIKETGFFFAYKKKAWYFRSSDFKSKSRGSSSLEDIREKYGSSNIRRKQKNLA